MNNYTDFRSLFYYFWKKLAEKRARKHYRNLYVNEYKFFETNPDKKSSSQMKKEMKVLQKYWGCYPFQYIRYGMYRKSCTMTMEEMKDYIPNYFAYYLFFPKVIKDYLMISEDKELTYQVLNSMGVRQPKLILQYKNGVFYDHQKTVISCSAVDKIILESKAEKLFLKPTGGLGGKGIMVFNNKDRFVDSEDNILSSKFIQKTLGNKENYIIQEGLVQHEELNKVYPKSVNTIRAYTHVVDGKAKLLFSLFRMGHGGKQIDNASQKGYVCAIDPNTGELSEYAISRLFERAYHHPDTNFIFKGNKIPFWKDIKDFVVNIAMKTEYFGFVGWDIAYTVDGPAVIEINASPGLHSLQESFGGVRVPFGITEPKKYWYSNKYILLDR